MKKERHWPEIYVDISFLNRTDIINKILRVDGKTYNVNFNHPVLGETVEIYHISDDNTLCLKSIYPVDMQDSQEEMETVRDYYNNYLLDGIETYLEYFNPDVGYFLLSRNVKELESFF